MVLQCCGPGRAPVKPVFTRQGFPHTLYEDDLPVARAAQLTSFSVVASCGLLPRTTRPGPRVWTAFWSVASLPLRDTRQSWTWSAPIMECSVILSEASLRAKSKDPQLVASSAWVADPSQAQDDSQPVEDPKRYGTLYFSPHPREMNGRPGPGLAGVAKREVSYGPKSGPKAGSRASSPGEQAAACDYIKTRELGRGLNSSPQLATTEKLVSWAGDSTQARSLQLPKQTRELGYVRVRNARRRPWLA